MKQKEIKVFLSIKSTNTSLLYMHGASKHKQCTSLPKTIVVK